MNALDMVKKDDITRISLTIKDIIKLTRIYKRMIEEDRMSTRARSRFTQSYKTLLANRLRYLDQLLARWC